jgi:glutaminyl-tRNA synthetase
MLVEGTTVEKKSSDGTIEKKVIPPTARSWDDPRLYTSVVLCRRGIPAKALLNFVEELGVTDALTDIQVLRSKAAICRHLEWIVPRLMLVPDPVGLIIEDAMEADGTEITIPYDPKGMIPGERKVKFTHPESVHRLERF